eukprot:PhF_6_TR31167/c0_g1_i3/m.45691
MDVWWIVFFVFAVLVPGGLYLSHLYAKKWIQRTVTPMIKLFQSMEADTNGDAFLKCFHKKCFEGGGEQKGIMRCFCRAVKEECGKVQKLDLNNCKIEAFETSSVGVVVQCKVAADFVRMDVTSKKPVTRILNVECRWTQTQGSIVGFVLSPVDDKDPINIGKHITMNEIEPYAERVVSMLLTKPVVARTTFFHESITKKFSEQEVKEEMDKFTRLCGGWIGFPDVENTVSGCDTNREKGMVVVSVRTNGEARDGMTKLSIMFSGLTPVVVAFESVALELKKKIMFV